MTLDFHQVLPSTSELGLFFRLGEPSVPRKSFSSIGSCSCLEVVLGGFPTIKLFRFGVGALNEVSGRFLKTGASGGRCSELLNLEETEVMGVLELLVSDSLRLPGGSDPRGRCID